MSEELETTTTEETTATATEGESIVSSVTDAAKDAAKEAAVTAVTDTVNTAIETITSIDSGKSLLEKANEKITELTKEIGTTKSPWVKIRNSAEIGVITVLIAGASAGVAQAVKELGDKVK